MNDSNNNDVMTSSVTPEQQDPESSPVRSESSAGNWITAFLLLGILFHLVYLTKDLGVRVDLTEEKLYSLTPSTQKVLDSLEETLTIEAYFSKKIPGYLKARRSKIMNLLDEYEQMGGDKVRVVYFDPYDDERIREKADNLNIRELELQDTARYSLSVMKIYQGLRIRYGGDRQKTLPILVDDATLETKLTPAIRELVLEKKPKLALVSRKFQEMGMFRMQGMQSRDSFRQIEESVRDNFEVVSVDLSSGDLLPEDLNLLVLLQPLNLSDWEKYVIDQHVMRGGNLIVFQESADYSTDMMLTLMRKQGQVDAPESKLPWKEQLAGYGLRIGDQIISDWSLRRSFVFLKQGQGRFAPYQAQMPFWFNAVQIDWSKTEPKSGDFDKKLWSSFQPGINTDNPVMAGLEQLQFFWPSEAGLVQELPQGVEGEILARSSPLALAESPMPSSDPFGNNFIHSRRERLRSAPLKQYPLIATVSGSFRSAFADRELPKRPGQDKADGNGGLQEGAAAPQPQKTPQPEKTPQPQKSPQPQKTPQPQKSPEAEKSPEPKPQTAILGPPLAQPQDADAAKDANKKKLPAKIVQAQGKPRILVVGDASLVRDDFLQGFRNIGVQSQFGLALFRGLIDWLALDTDLIALRNRRTTDRSLKFGDFDPKGNENQNEYEARIASTKNWVLTLNTLLPVLLLVLFGTLIWMQRSKQKNRFLDQVEKQG
ncbi:MAG: hypothetical protein CSA62_13685 [Planctomycetota bacterium]|nr:MAG: hypothetical protein CSA62_13685 [Planctomycetota bacterium]